MHDSHSELPIWDTCQFLDSWISHVLLSTVTQKPKLLRLVSRAMRGERTV